MKTLEELKSERESARRAMALRLGPPRLTVKVGMGDIGLATGARETLKAFSAALATAGVQDVAVLACGCCCAPESQAPTVTIEEPGKAAVTYAKVGVELARQIVEEHIMQGRQLSAALLK